MTENIIYIPFPKELYDDIIRFSDGEQDPASVAEWRVRGWVENLDSPDDTWGDRAFEVAEKYNPDRLKWWIEENDKEHAESMRRIKETRKALVWKEITVKHGTEVRMAYGKDTYFASVNNGKIVDQDGEFSPSAWAYKIAGNTARNAWRDIWFKETSSSTWVPAQLMRSQAKEELASRTANV
jgi:hypothetical protein